MSIDTAADDPLLRPAATMTALTVVSRLTGFIRVVVVAAVLGTTFLGNTYASANTVPNLLFELFAAGMLQAVLVPTLVDLVDRGDRREADRVAGSVLGLAGAGLAVLAGIGMLLAPWIMRALVSGVDDPSVRADQVRLGTLFLWFFLPQVVLYAAGAVASGALNATNRFAAPVVAPAVNNVVVVAAYGLFWFLRDGRPPTLDLRKVETLTLAGGTTLAVLAFCSVPVLAARRAGFSLRPRFEVHHPVVRQLGRRGAWAAVYLAMTQVLLAVVLVLCNRVEGGVVAYTVAQTFFVLPHALFATPVFTALYPRLARDAGGDWRAFDDGVVRGIRLMAFFVVPAAAALMALAHPIVTVTLFGESGAGDVALVSRTLAALAPGLLPYGAFLLLTRAFYAAGDARTPALVNAATVAAGSVAMAVGFALASGPDRMTLVGAAHSATYLVGALVLAVRLSRVTGHRLVAPLGRPRVITVAAAAAAGAVMWAVVGALEPTGRAQAAGVAAVAGVAGGAVYLAGQRLSGPLRLTLKMADPGPAAGA
ncbi:MAG TPA: lipid II flippase MurJ [Acidimicrobiales bacterium]|nr:lipid II flippase MurJ [Acidimicrobiales bacterium]